MRLAPYNGTVSRPRTAPAPASRVDAEKVIANKTPHGVKRPESALVTKSGKGHLRGAGARASASLESPPARHVERHHYENGKASVRFSQGVVTSAPGANIVHEMRKRTAVTQVTPGLLKPLSSTASTAKAAKGAVPLGNENESPRHTGKAVQDPFRGETLQGTSLRMTRGSEKSVHRSQSLEVSRRELNNSARPKCRGTVSEAFIAAHPEPFHVRTNEDRYESGMKTHRRVQHESVQLALTPPWMK
jgi:hypothetical protein